MGLQAGSIHGSGRAKTMLVYIGKIRIRPGTTAAAEPVVLLKQLTVFFLL